MDFLLLDRNWNELDGFADDSHPAGVVSIRS